ncbi:MAG: hypothetical protein AB7P08_05670 [Burkholderiales bacterium]
MHPRDPAWRLSAAALLVAVALPAAASDKPCTEADKAVDGVTTWAALRKTATDYAHCDKGQTAELFTEAILRVVISGWHKVADAGPILEKDEAFRRWLHKRLSSPSLATQDSAEIRDLAKSSCPKGQDKVCAELLNSVELSRAISAPDLLLLPPPAPAKGTP